MGENSRVGDDAFQNNSTNTETNDLIPLENDIVQRNGRSSPLEKHLVISRV